MPVRERPPLYRNDYGAFKYENQEMCTYEKKKMWIGFGLCCALFDVEGNTEGENRGI